MRKKLLAVMVALAMLSMLTVSACAAAGDAGFADVDADAWYAEAVAYCREHGLMNGTSDTTFEPESNLTRAMLVTVLYRSAGSPAVTGADNFTDTVDGAYYADAVVWASQQSIVSGYGNGLFGTNDPVTREQMTAIFWRYAGSPESSASNSFSDAGTVASYAASAVNWAGENGIIIPVSDNVFAPKSNATRAQVASALMNLDLSKQTAPTPDTADGSSILIAYFSFEGHTKQIAEDIYAQVGGDLFEITPETPYVGTRNDLSGIASTELRENARPALATHVDNMDQYDVVFVGYPCWWSDAPMAVFTFLEEYDFSGKTIVPFTSYGTSGWGNSLTSIQRSVGNNATMVDGFSVQEDDMQNLSTRVTAWLQGIGLAR